MSTNTLCDTDGCSQLTVAKCIHCNNHLCLKCLTRHQQPVDLQLSQLTNDMNRLLAISSATAEHAHDDDDLSTNHPQVNANKQYTSIIEQIDRWEMTMTKRLNALVAQARNAARSAFEQVSFEIEEWSTEKQIEIQQLTDEIEQLASINPSELSMRLKIDQYQRHVQQHINEYEAAHVDLSLINTDLIAFPPSTLQLFSLFEHSIYFDLSLIRDPPSACFDASKSLAPSPTALATLSPSTSLNRREKIFLPSVLVSSQHRILLFSNRAKLLNIFSISGTLIDQFVWNYSDVVDICYDYSSSTSTIDTFFVLSTNGSVYSLEYDYDQRTYSWLNMMAVNNQTYYTQIICDAKLSYLYLFMPSKHRLDRWTINKTKRNIIQCTQQLIITNDHVEHLCTSHDQLALLLRDKRKTLHYRIELRHFSDLLITICSITLDRLSKPWRLTFDNRHGFILAHGNQLCSFGSDGDILHKRVFDDIHEIKRVTFCQRSTVAILTENDQLLFYLLTK